MPYYSPHFKPWKLKESCLMCNSTNTAAGRGNQKDSEKFFLCRTCTLVLCINCDAFSRALQIDGHLSTFSCSSSTLPGFPNPVPKLSSVLLCLLILHVCFFKRILMILLNKCLPSVSVSYDIILDLKQKTTPRTPYWYAEEKFLLQHSQERETNCFFC